MIEYIKTYDIVCTFKSLIARSLPSTSNHAAQQPTAQSLLSAYFEKLNAIKMAEFNSEATVTPQIIQMTTYVDQALNEIQHVFARLVDDFIGLKYEKLDLEKQMGQLRKKSVPLADMTEKDELLKSKELELQKLQADYERLKKTSDEFQAQADKYKKEIEDLENDIRDLRAELDQTKASLVAANAQLEQQPTSVPPRLPSVDAKPHSAKESSTPRQLPVSPPIGVIMFTRFDAERNALGLARAQKRSNNALNEQAVEVNK